MNIVGDCTLDHTAEVVAEYDDSRLRFFNLAEKSPPGSHGAIAKNHAAREMSNGGLIAYLDDDDRYRTCFLGTMVDYMETHEEARFVYCRATYYDKRTHRRILGNPFQRWLHGYSREKLQRYNFIDTDCVVHEKALFDEVGYWNPDYYFDDYELWLRISGMCDLHYLNKVLVNKFVEEPPFLRRALNKGLHILRHGRSTPLK
jgi:hypothetical protein